MVKHYTFASDFFSYRSGFFLLSLNMVLKSKNSISSFEWRKTTWIFSWTFSRLKFDRSPSVLIRFLWMMRNVLKQMKNQFSNFSDFLFFELTLKIHRKLRYKNDHNSKNKSWKNPKFDFSLDSADSASFTWIWTLLKIKIGRRK